MSAAPDCQETNIKVSKYCNGKSPGATQLREQAPTNSLDSHEKKKKKVGRRTFTLWLGCWRGRALGVALGPGVRVRVRECVCVWVLHDKCGDTLGRKS